MSNPVIKSPYPQILTGTTAPAITPSYVGQVYLDTTAKREYRAYGTGSSADWISNLKRYNPLYQFSSSTETRNYIYQEALELYVTSYTTIKTITLSDYTGKHGLVALVKVEIGGHTSTVQNGMTRAEWYIDVNNGSITTGAFTAAVTAGAGAPAVRLSVSGADVLVQVQSSNGSSYFRGGGKLEIIVGNNFSNNIGVSIS